MDFRKNGYSLATKISGSNVFFFFFLWRGMLNHPIPGIFRKSIFHLRQRILEVFSMNESELDSLIFLIFIFINEFFIETAAVQSRAMSVKL